MPSISHLFLLVLTLLRDIPADIIAFIHIRVTLIHTAHNITSQYIIALEISSDNHINCTNFKLASAFEFNSNYFFSDFSADHLMDCLDGDEPEQLAFKGLL